MFDLSLPRRRSNYSRKAIFTFLVPTLKKPVPTPQERCHGLARCGHSTFLALHANPRVEATLLPALMWLVNGGCWMANEELQGWVHVEVNRKCDSLLVQTNTIRDHRQISLQHCHIWCNRNQTPCPTAPPTPSSPLCCSVFIVCLFTDVLV